MAEKPKVEIIFRQKASTLIERSGQEPVVLLCSAAADTAEKNFLEGEYLSDFTEAEVKALTASASGEELFRALKYAFASSPKKVVVTNMGVADAMEQCISKGMTNAVLVNVNGDLTESTVSNVINKNSAKDCGFLAVVSGASATVHDIRYIMCADSTLIEYYGTLNPNTAMTAGEVNALYGGAIAACGVDRSITNYTLPLVSRVVLKTTSSSADLTASGLLYAEMRGSKVRVVAGVNTAEVGDSVTEDMQHIEVIMTMDMIKKDILDTFEEYYRGAYKNNYANQLLLIAAINGYFVDLGEEDVLDNEYDNRCDIDADGQRQAWITKGKSEAADWSEDKVKLMSFGRKVYLDANVKICQSMEDMHMYINLE